ILSQLPTHPIPPAPGHARGVQRDREIPPLGESNASRRVSATIRSNRAIEGPGGTIAILIYGSSAQSMARFRSEAPFLESPVYAQRPADARPRDGRLGP